MAQAQKHLTLSAAQTQQFFRNFAQTLKAGDVVGFVGELGAGKTTAIQAILDYFGVDGGESPTFVMVRPYPVTDRPGLASVVHVDAYRLSNEQDAQTTGLTDLLEEADAIVLVEWADQIKSLLPEQTIWVELHHQGENKRQITVTRS